jgi:uncharacterized protein (TIGR02391 family)
MSILKTMGGWHGITRVKIVHNPGTEGEAAIEVDALIQAEAGYFEIDTPIYGSDIVEVPDPRGGVDRRLAREVNMNNAGSAELHHIEVKWGKAPAPGIAPVRRLTFDNLHQRVQEAAGDLFADGHFASAISEAFKSIEVRVKQATGIDQSGAKLMAEAFQPLNPKLNVATETGQSGKDEREGFQALFRGAIIGIRNPKAHELFKAEDPQTALEYLGFASLLHRRIDHAILQLPDESGHKA